MTKKEAKNLFDRMSGQANSKPIKGNEKTKEIKKVKQKDTKNT